MAILNGPIQFTGKLDEWVAYKMRNSDKVILRRKPFIAKGAFKNEPQYAAMRRNSAEFAGCAHAGKMIRSALPNIMQLADYNMTPVLNRFCKAIQKQDTVYPHGQRSILFSQYRDALTSLAFTKQQLFDSVFKQRPTAQLLREKAEMHVHFGELAPGLNFTQPWNKPYFRFIISLGVIEDLHYTEQGYKNQYQILPLPCTAVFGDWMMSGRKMPAHSMIIKLQQQPLLQEANITCIGAIGIQMGEPGILGEIEPVKYASTARILAAV
ncbi:MAG: hypothetical protein ACOYVG_06245 [Bacteroidota bacterium]